MDWSALPPVIKALFIFLAVGAAWLVLVALQANRALYVLQSFGAVSAGDRGAVGRVTVGLVTRPGRRYSLRGVAVQAEHYLFQNQSVRFDGTWSLSERQIRQSLQVLRDGSEAPMYWGPRNKVRCCLRKNGTEMVLAVRSILGGYMDLPMPVDTDAGAKLIAAFEKLQQAPSRTFIEV